MKNGQELGDQLWLELEHIWPIMFRDCGANQFYLYYNETTPESNGGIRIGTMPGEHCDKIAGEVSGGQTKEQNFNRLYNICKTLPVLSFD